MLIINGNSSKRADVETGPVELAILEEVKKRALILATSDKIKSTPGGTLVSYQYFSKIGDFAQAETMLRGPYSSDLLEIMQLLQEKPSKGLVTALVSGERSDALEFAKEAWGPYRLAAEILCDEIDPTELDSLEWLAKARQLTPNAVYIEAFQGIDPTRLKKRSETTGMLVPRHLKYMFLGAAVYELSQEGESHRDKAKEHLGSCIDVAGGIGNYPQLVAQVLLKKLNEDPSWPKSLRNNGQ